MNPAFLVALALVLKFEGGDYHATDADDPNPTRKGVTQNTYDSWRSKSGLPTQTVFNMTDLEMQTIYFEMYWTPIHGDELPSQLQGVMLDMAVNAGPVRAIKLLQKSLNLEVIDGLYGPKTAAAVYQARQSGPTTAIRFQVNRMLWYISIADKPSELNELKSWIRRSALGCLECL